MSIRAAVRSLRSVHSGLIVEEYVTYQTEDGEDEEASA